MDSIDCCEGRQYKKQQKMMVSATSLKKQQQSLIPSLSAGRFDTRSLEIKTKSIEQTLVPLVSQVRFGLFLKLGIAFLIFCTLLGS